MEIKALDKCILPKPRVTHRIVGSKTAAAKREHGIYIAIRSTSSIKPGFGAITSLLAKLASSLASGE